MEFDIINNVIIGFNAEPEIIQIKIPSDITEISDGIFSNFKNLTSVILPESLIRISNNLFEGCTALREINLENVVNIGERAFKGCTALKQINLDNVNAIGEEAFCGCSALSNVKFGSKIGYLCNAVFCGCSAIEELDIPKNISYIGCECFKDCVALKDIKLAGVMEIDNNAFEHCISIYSINLPKSLLHIAPNAFSFCTNLNTVTLQNRFIDIDETAFEYNVDLKIKAVQYSTAYRYAIENEFKFVPTIISADYRLATSEEVAVLNNAGILFRMKVIDSNRVIISFDKSAKNKINQLIGFENSADD